MTFATNKRPTTGDSARRTVADERKPVSRPESFDTSHMSVMVHQLPKQLGEDPSLWTALGIEELALLDQHVEIEAVAIVPSGTKWRK